MGEQARVEVGWFTLIKNACFCAWWTILFDYSLNQWSKNIELNQSLVFFTTLASAFLMCSVYLTLVQELMGKFGCLRIMAAVACLNCLCKTALFCFFFVYSIMGAVYARAGYGPDMW